MAGWPAAFTREQIPILLASHPKAGFCVPQQISPMLATAHGYGCCYCHLPSAICHLPPASPSLAWAWHGVASQGGQGLAQKSVSLLALLSGSSRPVFDAARGDGHRGRGGDWLSVALTAHLNCFCSTLFIARVGPCSKLTKSTNDYSVRRRQQSRRKSFLENHLLDPVIIVSSQDPWFLTIAALCSRPPTEKPQDPLQNRPDLFSP